MGVMVSIDFMKEVRTSLEILTEGQRVLTEGQRHLTEGQRHLTEGQRHLTEGQQRLEGNVAALLSGAVALEAELQAKLLTVSITSDLETNNEPCGHGLLIQKDDNSIPAYYLLTAAHVLASLDQRKKMKIRWVATDTDTDEHVFLLAEIQCIFLDKRYIASGTHDIGLARLEIEDMVPSNWRCEFVTVAQKIELGRVVTGLARVFLRGTVVHEEESCHRVFIAAVSAPGCSGCPLFDSEKKLVALVHGSSKHRHLNSIDDASSSVYGDACFFHRLHFQKVKPDWIKWLNKAENWSEEDARKSSECLSSPGCPERTRQFWRAYSRKTDLTTSMSENQISWDIMMGDLSEKSLDAETVLLRDDLQCLAPQTSVPTTPGAL